MDGVNPVTLRVTIPCPAGRATALVTQLVVPRLRYLNHTVPAEVGLDTTAVNVAVVAPVAAAVRVSSVAVGAIVDVVNVNVLTTCCPPPSVTATIRYG